MKRALSILIVLAIALLLVVPRLFAGPAASNELGDDGDQTFVLYYGPINAALSNSVLEHEQDTADSELISGLGDSYER